MTAGTPTDVYLQVLEAGLADESIYAGIIGMLIGTTAPAEERVDGIIGLVEKFPDKPIMLMNIMERDRNWEVIDKFHKAGVAVLPTMKYGFRAIRHLADFIEYNSADRSLGLPIPEKAPSEKTKALSEVASKKMLFDAGVPVDLGEVVQSADAAVQAAVKMGFPVVLKIESDEILHKSDVGGVKLNIGDEEGVKAAYDEILASVAEKASGAKVNGILVQKMLDRGVEIILGINSDPQFGPMLLVGLGGVFVEVFQDAALYPCPLNKVEAAEMLESLKAYKLLTGYRGGEPCDVDALIDVMVKVSDFAVQNKDSLRELDINPLFVYPKGKGVAIADALVILND